MRPFITFALTLRSSLSQDACWSKFEEFGSEFHKRPTVVNYEYGYKFISNTGFKMILPTRTLRLQELVFSQNTDLDENRLLTPPVSFIMGVSQPADRHSHLVLEESEPQFAPTSHFAVLTDLDGTALPRPYGSPAIHPPVQDGPVFAPLVRLLEGGATIIGVTGSAISSHQSRFFDPLPLEARRSGRVLLAVETGRRLFVGSSKTGEPIEDLHFAAELAEKVPLFTATIVDQLVACGRAGIRKFLVDLRKNPALIADDSPLVFMRDRITMADALDDAIPINPADGFCPRIEIRPGGAVVFVGVPSTLGASYFHISDELQGAVDGRPTGRMCFDCVPRGLDKSLVVAYLLQREVMKRNRGMALGDQPSGNDEGLTRWHEGGIPFVAVAERAAMVPDNLRTTHVTALSNEHASAAVLDSLATWLEKHGSEHAFGVEEAETLVAEVNEGRRG